MTTKQQSTRLATPSQSTLTLDDSPPKTRAELYLKSALLRKFGPCTVNWLR